ncbi:MAG: adenylosuccinate lyase [Methanocellales archaeon]|nr:adenylosuccinate lyase [Methanocellales archaeon]MDD3421492.1 adenylosuccinate lyase [Methanocellales archaeon]MDD5447406.1 adenylosuccinate lyase [Methanocellales archaeon]
MAIHPIEYRYGTPEMKKIWTEEVRLRKFLEVEAALARAEADVGLIPKEAATTIAANLSKVKVPRAKEIEDEIGHDMMAVVLALAEQCGDAGEWIHFGATSNDISDTALALQMRDGIDILEKRLRELKNILVDRAVEHKHTVCVSRTHGQIGVPTTYGLRFAIWASEVGRHLQRLNQLKPRILVGQMSGAAGTGAAFAPSYTEIKDKTMQYLGLGAVDVSNQLIQRDRYAELVMFLANVATTLDKIGIALRNLQRSEIAEVEESFGSRQVGSSTMPHKRNPIKSEQVCGLARVIRSKVEPALLNNTLWDERDLTNSSCERIIFPEVMILTDHTINTMIKILQHLQLHPENIRKNLDLLKGVNMSEAVMIELAKRVGRQRAHDLLRTCAMNARKTGKHMADTLLEDEEIIKHLSPSEIEHLMNPENYIGAAVEQVELVAKKLRDEP